MTQLLFAATLILQLASTVSIVGGSRMVQFGFDVSPNHPGFIPLDVDIDWRGQRLPATVWNLSGPKTGELRINGRASAHLVVTGTGKYVVQVVVSDGGEIQSDSVTIEVRRSAHSQ